MVDTDTVVEHAAAAGRDRGWRRFISVVIAVLGVSVVALFVWAVFQYAQARSDDAIVGRLTSQVRDLASAQDTAAVAAAKLADQLRTLGVTPVVSPPAPVTGPAGPQGPGPSQAQIDDAVGRYLSEHPPSPGQNATAAQVAEAVGAYLSVNPPAPGRPPTAEEIAGAVATYCAGHGGCAGPAGQSATDGQVAQAVATYCGQSPSPCAGPPGPSGAVGPQGPTGAAGESGAPGAPPAGWTYRDALGLQHTCTRSNTDNSAPTYSCS